MPADVVSSRGSDEPRRLVHLTPRDGEINQVSGQQTPVLHSPTENDRAASEEEQRVAARVNGWLLAAVSRARVNDLAMDPQYAALGKQLRKATEHVPKLVADSSASEVGKTLARSLGAGAKRYAVDGVPYTEPEGRLESIEHPAAVGEAAGRGNPDGLALSQFLSGGSRLQEFGDGRAGLELFALVELRQPVEGPSTVDLVKKSGLEPFDVWVLDTARRVHQLSSPDAGVRSRALRSLWRFDGVVSYRRKLRTSDLNGRAMVGILSMAALGLLSGIGHSTPANQNPPQAGGGPQPDASRPLGPRVPGLVGRFDEIDGDLDVVDLTNPSYDCRLTLLEAD